MILLNAVIKKFPADIIYKLHAGTSSALQLKEFRVKLKELIMKREQLDFNGSENDHVYITEALAVKASTSKTIPNRPAQKCIYCASEKHWSDKCDKYVTLESRKEGIKGHCFIYVRKNHVITDCKWDHTWALITKKRNWRYKRYAGAKFML